MSQESEIIAGDKSTSPLKRNRQLNVIYFVDSNKTRSFKINLRSAYWLAGALLFLMSWTIISSTLLYMNTMDRFAQDRRIQSLMTTIFNYQVKYDQIYERTYPNDDPNGLANDQADEDSEKVASAIAAQDQTTSSISPPTNDQQTKDVQTVADANGESVTVPLANPDSKIELPISLSELETDQSKTKLIASFAILNNITPEKVSGNLWGVATYKTQSGSLTKVISPTQLDDTSLTSIKENLQKTASFSIRRYKKHNFEFPSPESGGTFLSLEVHCLLNDKPYLLVKKYIDPVDSNSLSANQSETDHSKN